MTEVNLVNSVNLGSQFLIVCFYRITDSISVIESVVQISWSPRTRPLFTLVRIFIEKVFYLIASWCQCPSLILAGISMILDPLGSEWTSSSRPSLNSKEMYSCRECRALRLNKIPWKTTCHYLRPWAFGGPPQNGLIARGRDTFGPTEIINRSLYLKRPKYVFCGSGSWRTITQLAKVGWIKVW